MSRLSEEYKSKILNDLMLKLNCKNIYQVPKITKIVLNMGIGDGKDDAKLIDKAQEELSLIAGLKAIKTKAVDTNGAGDIFAGAVLNKISEGKSLQTAAEFGCLASSKKVEKFGPRLSAEEYKNIKKEFQKLPRN